MDANNLEAALRACADIIEKSPQPVADIGRYFEELADNPAWPADDIIELQSLFIQSLVARSQDAHLSDGHQRPHS